LSFETSTFASASSMGDFATLPVLFDAKMEPINSYLFFGFKNIVPSNQCYAVLIIIIIVITVISIIILIFIIREDT
jgi:hypothetical protein